jgi:hypothetical protein
MVPNTKDDFDHPMLSATDPLRPHVLYRLARADLLPDEKLYLSGVEVLATKTAFAQSAC